MGLGDRVHALGGGSRSTARTGSGHLHPCGCALADAAGVDAEPGTTARYYCLNRGQPLHRARRRGAGDTRAVGKRGAGGSCLVVVPKGKGTLAG